jgi:hypothetical protein
VAALDGEVLIVGPDGEVLDGIELDTPVSRFELGGRCLPVVTETGVAIIEVASGEILAEENIGRDRLPFVVRSADDACVVFATGDEDVLFGADATAGFGPREALAGLSEDGSAYAVSDADGVIEVRTVGTVPGAAIELDVGASSSIHFLRR